MVHAGWTRRGAFAALGAAAAASGARFMAGTGEAPTKAARATVMRMDATRMSSVLRFFFDLGGFRGGVELR